MTENNGKISGASFFFFFFCSPFIPYSQDELYLALHIATYLLLFYSADFILPAQTFHFSDRLRNPI